MGQVTSESSGRRVVGHTAWAGGSRVVIQILQFGSQLVLARLLAPSEFGLVASVSAILNYAAVFTDLGITAALVQAKNLTSRLLSSAFWLNAFTGLVLTAAVFAAAPTIAQFYGRPELVGLTRVLSLAFGLSLAVVPLGVLERELRFKSSAVVEVSACSLAITATLLAALAGWGAYALTLGPLATMV